MFNPNTDTLKPIPDPEALDGYMPTENNLSTIIGIQGLSPTKISPGSEDSEDSSA
jgi:hypothetical protein